MAPGKARMSAQLPLSFDALLDLLVPDRCLGCRRSRCGYRATCGLCRRCFAQLRKPPRPACAGCGLPFAASVGATVRHCGLCLAEPPAFDRLLALWEYRPPLDRVIRGLKFHRLDYLGAELAGEIADQLEAELDEVDLVTPIPLHWLRRWARGFNQAERIARPLASRFGLPFAQVLARRRSTKAQTSLARGARLAGPRGAFGVSLPGLVRERRILLVDDVATTGSTLREAAAALARAGARSVVALAVALTPPAGGGSGTVLR